MLTAVDAVATEWVHGAQRAAKMVRKNNGTEKLDGLAFDQPFPETCTWAVVRHFAVGRTARPHAARKTATDYRTIDMCDGKANAHRAHMRLSCIEDVDLDTHGGTRVLHNFSNNGFFSRWSKGFAGQLTNGAFFVFGERIRGAVRCDAPLSQKSDGAVRLSSPFKYRHHHQPIPSRLNLQRARIV